MYKNRGLLNKTLAIGFVILFIVTFITPEILAVDYHLEFVKDSNNQINKIKPYETNIEIITRINGYAKLQWIKIKKVIFPGLSYGEADIIKGNNDGVNLIGLKSINEFKKIFFHRWAEYIHAPNFIGYAAISMVPGHERQHYTFG
jgi:hypothetical protein